MFQAVFRVLIIAMMLVAFIGQAIAFNSSMSCETSVDTHSHNVSEQVKHYDLNPIDITSQEDCCGIKCCDVNCICIANACSSFEYFNIEIDSKKIATLKEVVYMEQSKQPKSIAALLYRPPIITS